MQVAAEEQPSPTPTAQVAQAVLAAAPLTNTEAIKAEIRRVFGPLANEALCIAENESNFRANATGYNKGGSYDRGVFQLNSHYQRHISDAEAYDAHQNIRHAKQIRDEWGNWGAWATRHKCNLT